MSDNQERIIDLIIKKRLGHTLSDEELQELLDWADLSPDNKRMFQELTDPNKLAQKAMTYAESKSQVFEVLQQSIPSLASTGSIRKMQFSKYAVAATIFAAAIIGYILFHNKGGNASDKKQAIALVRANDVNPGSNKATLKLSNGAVISLDSTLPNGKTFLQANAKINVTNTLVSYNSFTEKPNSILEYNELITPRAGQFQLSLPDGTKVWLNNSSKLRYPTAFNNSERKVQLTGEAYFEVAHKTTPGSGTRVPFIVELMSSNSVSSSKIEVLGTHFNVQNYDDEEQLQATLLEGSIKFTTNDFKGVVLQSIQLHPGQQANFSSKILSKVKVENNIDLDGVIAWKNGQFHFQNADVKTLMRQLSRWYDIDVQYEAPVTTHLFSGDIQRNLTLVQLSKLLSDNLHIKIEGTKITVLP